MSLFVPNLMLNNVTDIDMEFLQSKGIKGIILDVDNTLTMHNSQEVHKIVLNWLESMKEKKIKLTIVSNNTEKRIRPFAQRLGLDYISFGCKPLTKGLTQAVKKMGLKNHEVCIVGDQIYTDILGGNIKGLFTILVVPFELENTFFFKVKRKLEKLHIDKYNRLNKK